MNWIAQLPGEWKMLALEVNGVALFGQPGVRDPDAPCAEFLPGEPEVGGSCSTDGHHMCSECVHCKLCSGCRELLRYCECDGEML